MRFLTPRAYRDLPLAHRTWLIPGLLPLGTWTLIVGAPKSGKSFLSFQLAASLALGRPFLGYQPLRPYRVAYVDIDSPASEIWERIDVLTHALDVEDISNLGIVHPDDVERPVDITKPAGAAWLAHVREWEPDVIVLDVLREYHSLDEDESHEVKRVTDAIATAFPPPHTLVINHHTRKLGEDVRRIDPIKYTRGSGGLTGRVDAVWMIHRADPESPHGIWHRATRYEKASKTRLIQDADGLWASPDVAHVTDQTKKALTVCETYATLTHAAIAKLQPHGWSPRTFYRMVRGQPCCHRQGGMP